MFLDFTPFNNFSPRFFGAVLRKATLHLLILSYITTEPDKMVYIRQHNLPKLHEYKYSGVDHSLVSKYILKPFYTNVVIERFPMSMA